MLVLDNNKPIKNNFYKKQAHLLCYSVISIFFFFTLNSSPAFATHPLLKKIWAPFFKSYTVDDGMSQSSVNFMIQDKDEFIWLSTPAGIDRFNGFEFESISFQKTQRRNSRLNIVALFLNHQQQVSVITQYGNYFVFDSIRHQFVLSYSPNINLQITHAQLLNNKQLFLFGLNELHVLQLDSHPIKSLPPPTSTLNTINNVYNLAVDNNNILWVSTRKGKLYSLDVSQYNQDIKLIEHPFNKILTKNTPDLLLITPFDQGGIIAGFYLSGELYHVNHQTIKPKAFPNLKPTLKKNNITAMLQTSKEDLWISTFGSGLFKINLSTSSIKQYKALKNQKGSLSSNNIRALFLDKQKQLWISSPNGTNFANIEQSRFFQIGGDQAYTVPLASSHVSSILSTTNGRLWIGSHDAGLSLLTPKIDTNNTTSFQSYQLDHYTDPVFINALGLDSNNHLWVGGAYFLYWLNATTGNRVAVSNEWLPTSKVGIKNLLITDSEKLLIDFNNLLIYQGADRSVFQYQLPVNAKDVEAFSVIKQTNGKYFLASPFSGVLYYFDINTKTLSTLNTVTKNGSAPISIISLWLSPKNELWIGTDGEGIIRKKLNNEQTTWLTTDNGLPDNKIYGILGDSFGNAWITSNKGLSRYDNKSQKNQSFTVKDGLQSNEFNQGSIFRSKDGLLFFGGINGITVIDENNFTPNTHIPKTYIQSASLFTNDGLKRLKIFKESLETLDYHSNSLSFKIGAIDLLNPDDITYAYRFKNRTDEWYDLGTKREFNFLKLAAGDYHLQVTSCNSENTCNPSPKSVYFSIPPPPWLSWWAFVLYALALGAIIIYFIKNQQNKLISQIQQAQKEKQIADELRKLNTMKDQFLANTSHELRTPLNGIIGLSEMLLIDPKDIPVEELQESLDTIHNCGNQLKLLVNDLLDFAQLQNKALKLKFDYFDITRLVNDSVKLLQPLAFEHQLRIKILSQKPSYQVFADVNRIRQVLYNLINNAIKFSERGIITIELTEVNQKIKIAVSDEGVGIAPELQKKIFLSFTQLDGGSTRNKGGIGLGLAICKDIIELHGGELLLKSKSGKGSEFSFYLETTKDWALQNSSLELTPNKSSIH